MKLAEKLRIQREAKQLYQAAIDDGKDHDEAAESMADAMKAKYGESFDWSKIIDLILTILALFAK